MNPKIVFDTVHLKSCESTQDEALGYSLANNKACLLIAKTQSAGRGRQGRSWISKNNSLLMSLTFPQKSLPEPASLLSLCVGLSVLHILEDIHKDFAKLSIKWPNDIGIFQKNSFKKTAGILIEVKKSWVVVGVGLNFKGPTKLREAMGLEELNKAALPKSSELAHQISQQILLSIYMWQKEPTLFHNQILEILQNKWMKAMWGTVLPTHWGEALTAMGLTQKGALLVRGTGGESQELWNNPT